MSVRYGNRQKAGTKSRLARQKNRASGNRAVQLPRLVVTHQSNDTLLGLMKTGRKRDKSKFRAELERRGVHIPVEAA